jgi:hypothetical protein
MTHDPAFAWMRNSQLKDEEFQGLAGGERDEALTLEASSKIPSQ